MNKCPYCNKRDCVNDLVFANVENYGDNVFHITCNYCKKMIKVCASRIVRINSIEESKKPLSESDW